MTWCDAQCVNSCGTRAHRTPGTPNGPAPSEGRGRSSGRESGRRGSNPRHPAWEAGALPTELLPHVVPTVRPTVSAGADHRGPNAWHGYPPVQEPQVGIEPTTARLRIECSTTELLWRRTTSKPFGRLRYPTLLLVRARRCWPCEGNALARIRTATPFGTTPSRWRVYQFHHQGLQHLAVPEARTTHKTTGPTGLEPATSRVTVECSNQTELRPPTPHQPAVLHQHPTPAPLPSREPAPIAPTGVEPVSPP